MDEDTDGGYICLKCYVSGLYSPEHTIYLSEGWENLPCRCTVRCSGTEWCEVVD
jgi:hypothetical protein